MAGEDLSAAVVPVERAEMVTSDMDLVAALVRDRSALSPDEVPGHVHLGEPVTDEGLPGQYR